MTWSQAEAVHAVHCEARNRNWQRHQNSAVGCQKSGFTRALFADTDYLPGRGVLHGNTHFAFGRSNAVAVYPAAGRTRHRACDCVENSQLATLGTCQHGCRRPTQ